MSKFPPVERWIEGAIRRPKLCLAALGLLMAVQISPWLYPAVDGCLYLKTIRGFFTAEKLSDFRCYVPPGYLPLIAPAFAFGDRPFLAVSILQWLMALALIGGLYVWARRQFPATALLFTALVMVNISVWTYYRRPLKEVASMALLMWTVNLMHVLLDERRRRRVVWLTAVAALLATYLTLIRYAGITITVGFALAACWRARRGAFGWGRACLMSTAVGLSALGGLVGWLYYDNMYGAGGIYWREVASVYFDHSSSRPAVTDGSPAPPPPSEEDVASQPPAAVPASIELAQNLDVLTGGWVSARFAGPVLRFLHGFVFRINDVGCLLVPALWKASLPSDSLLSVPLAAFVVLFALIALGWRRIMQRKIDVLVLTLPAYLVLYSHWVCDQPGGRFMLPMLPILTACAWYGIAPFLRRPVVAFGLLAVAHLGQSAAYWLWIDALRAYQANKYWSVVDRIVEEIHRDPGQVAIADAAEPDCQGLWLELDWCYQLHEFREKPSSHVMWVVEPAGKKPLSGFSIRHVDGPVQLLCRDVRRAPHPTTAQKRSPSPQFAGNP